MPFGISSPNQAATQGQLGEVALSLARLASNLHLALETIENATGTDLAEVRREVLQVNQLSFTLFKDLTGWEGEGWGSTGND